MDPVRPPSSRELGVRLIVAYKAIKAVTEVAAGIALLVTAASGELAVLRAAGEALRDHLASRWSEVVGRAVAALLSERGIHLVELGLLLDGGLSAVEGWTLWKGYRWGPWLVVLATATPLPLEVAEIVRSPRAGRIVLALVNVAVVVYLARRIVRRRGAAAT